MLRRKALLKKLSTSYLKNITHHFPFQSKGNLKRSCDIRYLVDQTLITKSIYDFCLMMLVLVQSPLFTIQTLSWGRLHFMEKLPSKPHFQSHFNCWNNYLKPTSVFFIIVGLYVNYPYTLHVNDNLAYTDRESDEDSPKKPNNCSLLQPTGPYHLLHST